jgi:predicted phage-related endonuclease
VVERTGWNLRKVHRHIVHPKTPQFGGHLDYEVVAHDKGPGVVEIKTVDRMIFRDWPEGEPPIHYQLQLQSYLAITGRAWGALVALVGGNDLKIWEFDARPKTIEKIESAVAEFWRDVTDKREPKPDFLADAKAISALHSDAGGGIADLAGDNRIPELCANYLAAAADEKDAAERKAAAKSEILTKIGVADKGVCGEFTISATAVKATEPKIITPDMIGQSIGGRAGYRNIKITPRKGV